MKYLYLYVSTICLLISLLLVQTASATHLRAGEITAVRDPNDPLKYCFTLTTYTDADKGQQANDAQDEVTFFFGDGTSAVASRTNGKGTPIGNKTIVNYYKICHTFPAAGLYITRVGIQNRNDGTINIGANPSNISFFVETKLYINSGIGPDSTPVLLNPPIDLAIVGQRFCHNPLAFDADGDSLAYRLVKPKYEPRQNSGEGAEIPGYEDPANGPSFQGGKNETGTGAATFSINAFTGDLCWDAPKIAGQYNVAFIVEEWRGGVKIGELTRDMQIIVEDGTHKRPNLILPNDTCVVAGFRFRDVLIRATDPNLKDSIRITSVSGIYLSGSVPPPLATFVQRSRLNPANGVFNWQTACEHVRTQPYDVLFKAEDNANIKLTDLRTWRITVVAPQPTSLVATPDLADKSVTLKWDPYPCQRTGAQMLIWRKVACDEYTPGLCETGLAAASGYQVVGQVPLNATTFMDDNNGLGLEVGVVYSYRISASYALPQGGASYASQQACADIPLQVPVITNVSVDKTNKAGENTGQITVKWTRPVEVDKAEYAAPYYYRVLRAQGQNGTLFSAVSDYRPANLEEKLADTIFTDAGLNTKDISYRYKIEFYYTATKRTLLDTSRSASSVRVDSLPVVNGVRLTWKASVPWSNENQTHIVYRESRKAPGTYNIIAKVPVTGPTSFTYVDLGVDQVASDGIESITLNADSLYCYKVETLGRYGTAKIVPDSLYNLSQEICASPLDTTRPCPPVLFIDTLICQDYFNTGKEPNCNVTAYTNQLTWRYPSKAADNVTECKEVVKYNLYYSRYEGDAFELLATINSPVPPDTFFLHQNLPSYAGCYYVTAVDKWGNESSPSNTVCKDNCPYFALPNIITPNGDGKNDVFEPLPCPQFVQSVHFIVYNRWGKKVYETDDNILIGWDGRIGTDEQGKGTELSTGVYYYSAVVRFSRLRRQDEQQTFKGWVQVLK